MTEAPLYPLRFDPICQYRLWGGRRLGHWLRTSLPSDGPIGEAWMLSDRDEQPSRVAGGPLKGQTIAQLMDRWPELMLGHFAGQFSRFPLLLKFLDVNEMLSVQVHPADDKASLIPNGNTGKTEGWVILEAEPKSRIYAGLKPGVTAADLRTLSGSTVNKYLASFMPCPGQSVLIEAGTVHSLGDGVLVFEVQENSDVTFRLYDWEHVDAKTGLSRPLQVEQALACVDFEQGVIGPVMPVVEHMQSGERERLLDCSYFQLWRLQSATSFLVGAANAPRVLVCIEGKGCIVYDDREFLMEKGCVTLLPASIGSCCFRPECPVTLLEIAVPDLP